MEKHWAKHDREHYNPEQHLHDNEKHFKKYDLAQYDRNDDWDGYWKGDFGYEHSKQHGEN